MSSALRSVAALAAALLVLTLAPAPASAQDEYDWDSLDDEGGDDAYDWDALDDQDADDQDDEDEDGDEQDVLDDEDAYDWDELDAEDAGDGDAYDWDALEDEDGDDGAAEAAGEDGDDYDWDALDEGDDGVDWDSYWDELDAEDEVEAVEVPVEVAEDRGGVQGQVLDDQTGEPFPRATVTLSGTGLSALSDAEGRFYFDLEPGEYVLRVDHFELEAVSYQVLVEPGQITDLASIRMRPSENTSTIVVEGRAIRESTAQQLRERQESATVQDAVSAEQISQAGDSSAASAVRRVVGVTLVDGRFLVVRGLGGRYTQVTLNGVPVPLTDPDATSAEVDLFPTEVLSSLTLAKNPLSPQPSFTGGLMNIETRAYPEEFELALSASLGGDTATTFRDFERDPLGGHDALGFDDGSREWPALPSDQALDRRTVDDYEQIARAMPHSWHTDTVTARPDLGLKLNVGDSLELGDRELGYLLIASYGNEFERRERTQATTFLTEGDGLAIRERLDVETHEMQSTWSTLGNLGFELAEGHTLRLVSLWNHRGTETYEIASGPSDEEGGELSRQEWNWVERNLTFTQLLGSHRRLLPESSPLHETRIDWTAALGLGSRDEPDTRFYKEIDGTWNRNPGSGEHFRSSLDQRDVFADLRLQLPYLDTFSTTVGGSVHDIQRDFESRRLRYTTAPSGVPATFLDLDPDEQFSDENVDASGTPVRLSEFPNDGDSSQITQLTLAGFGAVEINPLDWLRVTGGARYQTATQEVRNIPLTREANDDDESRRVDGDVLGAGGLHFEVAESVFVRAVYGGSVAYPLMREIAPFRVQNYTERRTETGNPDLIRTYVHNYDLRTEWFPSATEVIAASVFYKRFLHPIEPTQVNRQGDVLMVNADAATAVGVEIEAQVDLGRIGERARGLYAGANAAFVHSRIDLPCVDIDENDQCDSYTNSSRPMQGQAPWQLNARFGWDPSDLGLSLGIVFAALAPALETPGLLGRPDQYRQPPRQLDFIAGYEFDEHWKLDLKVRNLLVSDAIRRERDLVVGRTFEPVEASVGLRWAY